VVLAVVAGLVVAPSVYGAVTGPDGTVAVVEIDGSIDSATAQHVEDNLREARNNDSIEAVVLEVDSGGGLPAQSERMYAAVDRTASVMPVIATVDTLGASGAYLAIAPADKICVAPPHKRWGVSASPAPRRHRTGRMPELPARIRLGATHSAARATTDPREPLLRERDRATWR